jgi:hypothetical protein
MIWSMNRSRAAVVATVLVSTLHASHADDEEAPESTLDDSAAPRIDADTEDPDPLAILARRIVKARGNLVASPNLIVARAPFNTPSGPATVTPIALRAYAAAGITDTVTAGIAYSLPLSDGVDGTPFSARGPLTLFGSFLLLHEGPLDIAVGGDLVADLAGVDMMDNPETHWTLRGGATVRLNAYDKVAIYTGSPLSGTPQGRQLSIGMYEGGRSALSLPVGVAFQATEQVYVYGETTLLEIYFANGPGDGMGGTKSASALGDVTPLTLGALYSLQRTMDVGGALSFADLGDAKYFFVSLGARFHTGP